MKYIFIIWLVISTLGYILLFLTNFRVKTKILLSLSLPILLVISLIFGMNLGNKIFNKIIPIKLNSEEQQEHDDVINS